jgi:hypothetical protein
MLATLLTFIRYPDLLSRYDDDVPLISEKFDNYCQDLFKPSETKTVDKGQSQEIKPETMQRVQAIIAKHMKVIEPLLQELEH